MPSAAIIIRWADAREVVNIDLDLLRNGASIARTVERWDGCKETHEYKTTSDFVGNGKGGGTLTIYYRRHENTHLKGQGCRWGKSEIELDKNLRGGKATWYDRTNSSFNGTSEWSRFSKSDELLTDKDRKRIEVAARKQAQFRRRLLFIEPRCAITGESEVSVLEAAHVVPSASRGSEVDGNGIMLRADLHRLFDKGLFKISRHGKVIKSRKLSAPYYIKLFQRYPTVSSATLARIGPALRLAGKRKRKA